MASSIQTLSLVSWMMCGLAMASTGSDDLIMDPFPANFAFGVGSAAFTTEGGWDADGKGASIWDEFTKDSSHIHGGGDANKAADVYSKVKDDVKLVKALGVSHYRFSISWPRVLPDGTTSKINEPGIAYYNNLINELLANQIQPFVTLYHWDLPQALQDKGGWASPSSVQWFREFADLCFKRFGDRVKLWVTINDPFSIAYRGYETGEHAPGIKQPNMTYLVGHHLIKAHASAYRLYQQTYRRAQQGKVGISLMSYWFEPKTTKVEDEIAVNKAIDFMLGWFANPLTSGDYPPVVKQILQQNAILRGETTSRLPVFTDADKMAIKGAYDFLGINHYKTKLVSYKAYLPSAEFYMKQQVQLETDLSYPKLEYRPETNPDSEWRLMGFGLQKLLNHVTLKYGKPVIYVTENGLGSCGTLKDQNRISYVRDYTNNVLKAIKSGSDVRGYFVTSLVDGFEWDNGYTIKTGFYWVDMGLDWRPRYPRSSVDFYRKLVSRRRLDNETKAYRAYPEDRDTFYYGTFPDNFQWGVATSAYQIEGGWNADGKGPSIWDTFAHNNRLAGSQTGDVACDSYHRYMDDVQMLKDIKVNYYRFSIAWSRIMPDGTIASLNKPGINYYNNLIDALVKANITPMVTLYHWDLPQALQDHGGFQNDTIVGLFESYARVCFEQFGDRVKYWVTFNEAFVVSWLGYGIGVFAPGIYDPGNGVYHVAHNIIRSHSRAYRVHEKDFKARYGGQVGITLDIEWKEALTDSPQDAIAADRAIQFKLGWFGNAIYGGSGDYPQVMKDFVARKSKEQGLARSRLPEFTEEEKKLNNGAYDFLGMNHYTTNLIGDNPRTNTEQNYEQDQDVDSKADPCWPGTDASWLKVNPWGIRYILRWARDHFNNPPIFITESGRPDNEDLNDPSRVYYYKYYINELLKAIRLDGVDLRGYTAWSLMDNLEWTSGYYAKFGLYHVDFNNPNRTRTPRTSAHFYTQLIQEHGFPKP